MDEITHKATVSKMNTSSSDWLVKITILNIVSYKLLLLLTAFPFFRGRHSESPFSILPYSLCLPL